MRRDIGKQYALPGRDAQRAVAVLLGEFREAA
jgi:hypothetical protein